MCFRMFPNAVVVVCRLRRSRVVNIVSQNYFLSHPGAEQKRCTMLKFNIKHACRDSTFLMLYLHSKKATSRRLSSKCCCEVRTNHQASAAAAAAAPLPPVPPHPPPPSHPSHLSSSHPPTKHASIIEVLGESLLLVVVVAVAVVVVVAVGLAMAVAVGTVGSWL